MAKFMVTIDGEDIEIDDVVEALENEFENVTVEEHVEVPPELTDEATDDPERSS